MAAKKSQQRYELQRELGSGSMGTVWLARDTLLNRPVAIKYLTARQDALYQDFFLAEAQTLASLNHPNITLIYDAVFDEQDEIFYLVMEYVEGQSLSNLIEAWSGPLPLPVTLAMVIDLLQALDYAHSRGVVHRDIKPENVIIQKEGIKLTDFGLAGLISKLAEDNAYLIGTPAYMAPEQIRGEMVDGRVDLYSLGVMLFEMVSGGHQPFEQFREVSQLLEAHLSKGPLPLRLVAPHIPVALEHTILRLLSKDPEERHPSAAAVTKILRAIQARQKYSQPHLDLVDLESRSLVGREEELKRINELWTKLRSNFHPQLITIQGEPGLGKSSLVAEFLGYYVTDEQFVAIVGRCERAGIPYAPFAEVLAAIINKGVAGIELNQKQLEQLLNQIPGLARLLDISYVRDSATLLPDPVQAQWQLFDTILSILIELGPAVIFLEDADFLDESSLALTEFLLRQRRLPLLILAAHGDDEAAVKRLAAPNKHTIALPPLSSRAIRENLVNLMGGTVSEAVVRLIEDRSQGNPLYIEEITRQLVDSGQLHQAESGQWCYIPSHDPNGNSSTQAPPKSLQSAFNRRVNYLPEQTREALALAALIEPGPEFDFEVWLALLGGESQLSQAEQIRDEAIKRLLLVQVGAKRYAFRPVSIVDTLQKQLPLTHKRELHRQIAKILRQRQADPIVVGYHYEQAGQASEAAYYLETAGAEAMALNAINTATLCYERAVALVHSLSAYQTLGRLYRQQGKWADSLRAYQQALEKAELDEQIEQQAKILNDLAFTLWLYDDYREASQPAMAVLELPNVSKIERATAQSHLGVIAWLAGQLSEAEKWCRQSVEALYSEDDSSSLAAACNRLGLVHLSQGKLAEAKADFERSLQLNQDLADYWGQAHCLIGLGQVATEQGHFKSALTLFNSARTLFDKVNSQDGLLLVYKNCGRTMLWQGQPDKALPWLTKAFQLAMRLGKYRAYGLGDIYLQLGQVSLMQGELERARAATDDALQLVEAAGNLEYIAAGHLNLARIYSAHGDGVAAEVAYKRVITLFEQVGSRTGLLRSQHYYALFLRQQGQIEPAARLEREVQAGAAEIGAFLPG